MSVLETPRVYFRGNTTFDPITTNNYPRNYDEMGAQSVVSPADTTDKLRAAVGTYRAGAVAGVTTIGNWNPHGTYRSIFYETEVVGVDVGRGPETTDAFVGVPVSFAGMLVDLEPYGSTSSQLFFDSMSFGIDGGCQIKAARSMRMIARQINFRRNPNYTCIAGLASVVWQTSFPKAGLPFAAHGSEAIAVLQAAMQAPDVLGLTVRWNAYRTVYYDNINIRNGNAAYDAEAAALQAKLEQGGFQPNPARSVLVGVLGLWRTSDPAQVIGDRGLLSSGGPIATASARLNGTRLVVDFGNSIPETGPDLTKRDFGVLSVVANGRVVAQIPSTSYNKQAYQATAGLVTCTLDAGTTAEVATSDLSIVGPDGTIYLTEEPLHVCELTPNVYVEAGDTTTLQVQVLRRGVAAGAGVPVDWITISTSAPTSETSLTNSAGVASLDVGGAYANGANMIGQIDTYVATTAAALPDGFNTMTMTMTASYLYVRTLPPDSLTGQVPITWDSVYANVLYNWNALAPCMDNWLRLDDPVQVAAYGTIVKKLTAADNFESYRYMPITRDMNSGQRGLLYSWLDAQAATVSAAAPAAQAVAPEASGRNLDARSRAFQSG